LVNDFCACFASSIRGRYDRKLARYIASVQDISGGAQIRTIFNSFLEDYHNVAITDGMADMEIEKAMAMHAGANLPGFQNQDTFEYLIFPHLKRVKMPASECVNDVGAALDTICQKIARSVFRRFPRL